MRYYKKMVSPMIKALLLWGTIGFTAYIVATPGDQLWQAAVGGLCCGIYTTWQHIDATKIRSK